MNSHHKDFSQRRLKKATRHVASLWFPINPQSLAGIRDNFKKGVYADAPSKLLEDLKKDFALFTFLVKELMPIALSEQVAQTIVHNPAELLRWAGPARIETIIKDDSALPTGHVFSTIEPFQAERLRETAIVASTAEVLSESKNLDPDTGFARGVVREIGLNLIAWNYPSLFSRVIKSLRADSTLDDQLTKVLGFSPALLAMKVLTPDAVGKGDAAPALDPIWATYDQLCEIGEALARAENPERYPSAENDWKLARDYLKKTVGDAGVKLIKTRAVQHSKEYEETLTKIFKPLKSFNPEKKLIRHKQRTTAVHNRWLPRCSPEVQIALLDLYSAMADEKSSITVLESLLRRIIPQAGFTGGCVFIVDPAAMALLPRTVFGNIKLRPIERVALRHTMSLPLNETSSGCDNSKGAKADLVAAALARSQPVVERQSEASGHALTGMYGSLGDHPRIGVLYLEAPQEGCSDDQRHPVDMVFKAVRQALADALRLD